MGQEVDEKGQAEHADCGVKEPRKEGHLDRCPIVLGLSFFFDFFENLSEVEKNVSLSPLSIAPFSLNRNKLEEKEPFERKKKLSLLTCPSGLSGLLGLPSSLNPGTVLATIGGSELPNTSDVMTTGPTERCLEEPKAA